MANRRTAPRKTSARTFEYEPTDATALIDKAGRLVEDMKNLLEDWQADIPDILSGSTIDSMLSDQIDALEDAIQHLDEAKDDIDSLSD